KQSRRLALEQCAQPCGRQRQNEKQQQKQEREQKMSLYIISLPGRQQSGKPAGLPGIVQGKGERGEHQSPEQAVDGTVQRIHVRFQNDNGQNQNREQQNPHVGFTQQNIDFCKF